MAQTGFRWERPPEDVFVELTEVYVAAVQRRVYDIAQAHVKDIENWMKAKEHAKWQDHTGNARQTLYAEVHMLAGSMVEIILSHGMSYGIFLELNNAGRFAVIGPALDHWAPILWSEIVRMLSG